jgi:hypothetical protein
MALGPLVVLERSLCPRALEDRVPRHQVVIAGDVLAASLRRLPSLVPHRSVEHPHAQETARALAMLAPSLFAQPVQERPSGAVGAPIVPLGGGFRLALEVRGTGPVVLALGHEREPLPVVEWTVTGRTLLHLVKPDAAGDGAPRYAMQGIDLDDLVAGLVPIAPSSADTSRARTILRTLGRATGSRGGVAVPVERVDPGR